MSNMWGFDLDMTAVRLMRRDEGPWQEVAAERIEGADIEQRLMALVARIDDDAPVELFLPRDQILCIDVAITDGERAGDEIRAALDGKTPYPLDELDIDWEITAPGTARVAAIAFETLDEAVAFAEVRGVKVGGFSSLALEEAFPRLPVFTGHTIFQPEDPEEEEPGPPVTFASARVPSKPRPDAPSLAPVATDLDPVVKVEDDAPVMQLKAPVAPPLDPGTPMAGPVGAPRVRTDIAARAVSDQVASLTPPSVQARTGPSMWKLGAVMALALLVTVGVATLVWQLLPLGPNQGALPLSQERDSLAAEEPLTVEAPAEIVTPEVEVTEAPEAQAPEVEIAMTPQVETIVTPEPALPEETAMAPTPEVAEPDETAAAPEPEVAEPESTAEVALPDLPQPVILSAPDAVTAPAEDASADFASLAPVAPQAAPDRARAPASPAGLPFVDLGLPLEPAPAALAALDTSAPDLAAAPEAGAPLELDLAAIDPANLAFDAIALPNADQIAPSALPGRAENAATPAPAPQLAAPRDDGLPAATALAQSLTDRAPRARPSGLTERIERQKYGGRTLAQLEKLRPPQRPASAQMLALAERADAASASASDLAVNVAAAPRGRPRDFDAVVAAAILKREAEQVTASLDFQTPDTSAAIEAALRGDAEPEPEPEKAAPPTRLAIPSSASVARQATIENAIRLNRVNLVGVYGTAADRRAMVRLPSGRYVKVKVGDRVDGGTVAEIRDDELLYKKGSRTLSLTMPKG
ncbi:MAG: hypothetical protein OIF48_06225 [Silicimonas sp.]|nr:hypothetical protein [Silicimonas sp.]